MPSPDESDQALHWSAPGSCIREAELRERVQRTVRPEKIGMDRKVLGRMKATPAGYRATLRVQERGRVVGRRILQFKDRECRAADESLELVIAMLLEGGLREDERTAETPPAPDDEEPADDIPPREEQPSPAETTRPPVAEEASARPDGAWTLMAALDANFGLVPGVGLGPRLDAGVSPGWPVSLHLTGSFLLPRSSPPGSVTNARVRLSTLRLGGAVCHPFLDERWLVEGCAGVGALVQWGEGVDIQESTRETWVQGEADLSARVAGPLAGRWRWALGAELGVPFSQAEYFVETATQPEILFTTAPVFGSVFVGIHATF